MKNLLFSLRKARRVNSVIFILGISLICPLAHYSQGNAAPKINKDFDADSNKTAFYLEVIGLPNNSKKSAVGGAFEAQGERPSKMPCCMTIVFTSIGKKGFDYKDNHRVTFWADGEEFVFDDTTWKESNEGTAFVLAGIAFPEEIWVGLKTEQFLKIANAKTAKAQIGKFKFTLTQQQKSGLIALSKQIPDSKQDSK